MRGFFDRGEIAVYEMRRKRQQVTREACEEVVRRATSGVLAVIDADGDPYAVPLSFVYTDGKLYFHCAPIGHKIDAIRTNDRISFCVIDRDEVMPESFTTKYRSVIVFGRARILTDETEKRKAIEALAVKYAPDIDEAQLAKAITADWVKFCIIEVKIDHLTGKIGRELLSSSTMSDNKTAK